MNLHNEHNIAPGVYRHHKGTHFVVTGLITHIENETSGDMEELPREKMLIVYHDVERVPKMVQGKMTKEYHQQYSMTVAQFFKTIEGKPRFTPA